MTQSKDLPEDSFINRQTAWGGLREPRKDGTAPAENTGKPHREKKPISLLGLGESDYNLKFWGSGRLLD